MFYKQMDLLDVMGVVVSTVASKQNGYWNPGSDQPSRAVLCVFACSSCVCLGSLWVSPAFIPKTCRLKLG